jgi:carboxypeptidase D
MAREFPRILPFNDTFAEQLASMDETCGFTAFLEEYLLFPPKGIQPPAPNSDGDCDIYFASVSAMFFTNPCFDPYHITDTCPYPEDSIKNPPGGIQYFDRTDVKAAINAPDVPWSYCQAPIYANNDTDATTLAPPTLGVLPRVIERLNKTLIISGQLDLVLPTNGTLLAIQNMTWGGKLGFQKAPTEDILFVPYNAAAFEGEGPDFQVWSFAGTGVMGTVHAERGLTFVDVFLAGHQSPQWQPSAAFRQLEYLLGRVKSMSGTEDFTVPI